MRFNLQSPIKILIRTLTATAFVLLFGTNAWAQSSITTLYTWSATNIAGDIEMTGAVPHPSLQKFLAIRAPNLTEDNTRIVADPPEDFVTNAVAAMTTLAGLTEGRVAFTGAKWSVAGTVPSNDARDALLSSLSAAADVSDWIIFIDVAASDPEMSDIDMPDIEMSEPEMLDEVLDQSTDQAAGEAGEETPDVTAAAETETDDVVANSVSASIFTWVAESGDDGALQLSGNVPNAGFGRYLGVKAGGVDVEDLQVAPNAPENFIPDSLAGLEAAKSLSSARLVFTGAKWALSGIASTQEVKDNIVSALSASVDISDWIIFIDLPEFIFSATYDAGEMMQLSGAVSGEPIARYLGVIGGGADTSSLRIASNAPDAFNEIAVAGIRALQRLEIGAFKFESGIWSLSGEVLSPEVEAQIIASLATIRGGENVHVDLKQASLFQICADAVRDFSESHTILFAPASSILAEESRIELRELASELAKCPDTALHVEGHTDADGPANDNMTLSVARAESVLDELMSLGVSYTRLYAIGYGETLPIATNDTRAGKAQNRRIVFRLDRD